MQESSKSGGFFPYKSPVAVIPHLFNLGFCVATGVALASNPVGWGVIAAGVLTMAGTTYLAHKGAQAIDDKIDKANRENNVPESGQYTVPKAGKSPEQHAGSSEYSLGELASPAVLGADARSAARVR